jgi:hypothetical protein
MRKNSMYVAILLANLFSLSVFSQSDKEPEALGLPGDNLNLYAVLDVFQKSKTLEDFEKAINDKDNNINNLDLDDDKNIDYIQVVSEKDGDSHSIVLQVAVNEKERQDVAVIDVTKDKNGKVVVQIIGDEELYGKDYIVEPANESNVSGTPNPGYKSDGTVIINNNNTTNNYSTTNNNASNVSSVSAWPVVLFLFTPLYMPYISPWHWGYYPPYWHPWSPVFYHNYWGYHSHYYGNHYYHRTVVIRNPGHYNHYNSRRNTSVMVRNNRANGNYRSTYDGRTYKKPTAPNARPVVRPSERPSGNRPSTRPVSPNKPATNRPSTRPVSPSNNGATRPTTRPNVPSTNRPTTRPSVPTTRPASRPMPSSRPASSNRQSMSRPSGSASRMSRN